MKDVEALCKRVIIISLGKIIFDGDLSKLVRQHAPYKLIKVILKGRAEQKLLENFNAVKFQYPEVKFLVPNQKVGKITANILNKLRVDDLTIEDPSIEDIIRKIFKDQAK